MPATWSPPTVPTARSGTRLGIAMRGPRPLVRVISVQFRAPLWDVVGDHALSPVRDHRPRGAGRRVAGGPGRSVAATGSSGRQQTESLADYPDERLRDLIAGSAGVANLPVEIERVAPFSFAAQIADAFRAGNVFLVGDAAHRITPRGGTGMNTAIADGFDLAWKLAWVLKGWAPASLLDSYEGERRPIVEHNLARSAEEDGSRRGTLDEVHVDLRGRIAPPLGRHRAARVLDPSTSSGRASRSSRARSRSGDPQLPAPVPSSRRSPRSTRSPRRGMGIAAHGSLAVRPDGLPVAASPAAASRSPHAGSGWSPRRSA